MEWGAYGLVVGGTWSGRRHMEWKGEAYGVGGSGYVVDWGGREEGRDKETNRGG